MSFLFTCLVKHVGRFPKRHVMNRWGNNAGPSMLLHFTNGGLQLRRVQGSQVMGIGLMVIQIPCLRIHSAKYASIGYFYLVRHREKSKGQKYRFNSNHPADLNIRCLCFTRSPNYQYQPS